MDVRATGHLTADCDITILPVNGPAPYALGLGMYQPGGITVYADRAGLIRLRDAIDTALTGTPQDQP